DAVDVGQVDEGVGGVQQRLAGGVAERQDLDPHPALLSQLHERHEIGVTAGQRDDVDLVHRPDHVGRDAHVPVTLDDGGRVVTPVNPQPQPLDAVTQHAQLGVEPERGAVPFALDHVGGGVRGAATPYGGAQQPLIVDGARAMGTGGVVEVLRVDQQRDALGAPVERGGGDVGAHR